MQRYAKQLDVIHFGITTLIDRTPNPRGHILQMADVIQTNSRGRFSRQKEPVSAPRHVADDLTNAVDVKSNLACLSITRHVLDRHRAVRFQVDADDPDGRFDSVSA